MSSLLSWKDKFSPLNYGSAITKDLLTMHTCMSIWNLCSSYWVMPVFPSAPCCRSYCSSIGSSKIRGCEPVQQVLQEPQPIRTISILLSTRTNHTQNIMSWVKERYEQLKIMSLFLLESTVILNDPLSLRSNTQGEVVWRFLSSGVTAVLSVRLSSSSCPEYQASELFQMLGFQCPHFVWETKSRCLA